MKILKTYLLGIAFMICFCGQLYAQEVIKVKGTGQTTGHIATLTVANTSSESVVFEMGTAIIPSKEFETTEGIQLSQPQIHTGKIEQKIEPGEIAEIPVNGFCLDVGKPPLPSGMDFPTIDEWVTELDEVEKPNLQSLITSELPSSFQPVKREVAPPDEMNPGPRKSSSEWELNYPGTDVGFPYNINISKHPKDAAMILFPIVENIISAYNSLQQEGLISTPFAQNEVNQREAVIQQAIWLTTSKLQGEKYDKDDFSEQMASQFEEASGVKIDEAPEQQQEQFNEGIEQFWGAFELVGTKAKVIKPKVQSKSGDDEESNDCCDELRNSSGFLVFDLGNNGFVRINNSQIFFRVNGSSLVKTINFDFNLEEAFCDLDNNQVRRQIDSYCRDDSRVHTRTHRSIAMAGPNQDSEGRDPYYHLRYMEQININGELTEVSISISVDKETCEFSVQVDLGDDTYGAVSAPIYDRLTFGDLVAELENAKESYYWNRLLFFWAEHYKYDILQSETGTNVKIEIEHGLSQLLSEGVITEAEFLEYKNRLESDDEIPGLLMELADKV